jgi:tetratricopeptide (TPR) repeat protein
MRSAILGGLLVGLLAGSVHARAPRDEDTKRAKEHYGQGSKLFDLERFEEARIEFEAALSFKPDLGKLYYNIARCHEHLNQKDLALKAYEDYLKAVPDATDHDDIERRMAELRELTEIKQKEDEREAKQRDERRARLNFPETAPTPAPAPAPTRPMWPWLAGGAAVVVVAVVVVAIGVAASGPGTAPVAQTALGSMQLHF